MGDMDEHSGPRTADPTNQPSSGPRVSGDQMRDIDRLRRSTSDRYVAGVAGGLGRHFDVDPTIIRVVLAVLTVFGGAGVLVYGAVWLFVPEDGQDRAPVEVSTDLRRILLILAGVAALSIVFGTPFLGSGWGTGLPVPLFVIAVVAVALFATRSQRSQDGAKRQPPQPWATVPTSPGGGHPVSRAAAPATASAPNAPEGMTMPIETETYARGEAGPPPAWMPPPVPAYLPPPRPRRSGLLLFWPTLALIAIALGSLGVYDTSHPVTISAYGAVAVAITGVMLLIGAFVGRPGGLVFLGLVSSLALLVTSIVGVANENNDAGNKDVRAVPGSASAVEADYHVSTGTIELDLSRVRDLDSLDGRTVDLGTNAGDITVVVPSGLNVHVTSNIRYAGQINIGTESRDGLGQSLERTLTTSTSASAPTLDLAIEVRFGQITVTTQK